MVTMRLYMAWKDVGDGPRYIEYLNFQKLYVAGWCQKIGREWFVWAGEQPSKVGLLSLAWALELGEVAPEGLRLMGVSLTPLMEGRYVDVPRREQEILTALRRAGFREEAELVMANSIRLYGLA